MSTEHVCRFCGKMYIRKKAYMQHILMCEISKKSGSVDGDKGNNNHVPSNKELYEIIINLNNKYERLQEDYDVLKRFVDSRRRKIDILEWLNKNCILRKGNDFESVFINMQLGQEDLNNVFDNDYVNGIANIIATIVYSMNIDQDRDKNKDKDKDKDIENGSCLRAFTHREGIFYIYSRNKVLKNDVNNDVDNDVDDDVDEFKWKIMENGDFDRLIKSIDSKLLIAFKEWHLKTEKIMDEDKFAELYIKNLKKVMGGNFKMCEKIGKIKNRLYKMIKSEMKNVMIYDF